MDGGRGKDGVVKKENEWKGSIMIGGIAIFFEAKVSINLKVAYMKYKTILKISSLKHSLRC